MLTDEQEQIILNRLVEYVEDNEPVTPFDVQRNFVSTLVTDKTLEPYQMLVVDVCSYDLYEALEKLFGQGKIKKFEYIVEKKKYNELRRLYFSASTIFKAV